MTLLDEAAIAAMQVFLKMEFLIANENTIDWEQIAENSYKMAQAMVKEQSLVRANLGNRPRKNLRRLKGVA